MQRTSAQAGGLWGALPLQYVMGETVDISEYLDFGFYEHVYSKENTGIGVTSIFRWLGVSHRVGGLILYWILTQKGKVISQTTLQRITQPEKYIQGKSQYQWIGYQYKPELQVRGGTHT